MLILNFKSGTRFHDIRKNHHHFGLFLTPFSLEINFLLANFLIECRECNPAKWDPAIPQDPASFEELRDPAPACGSARESAKS